VFTTGARYLDQAVGWALGSRPEPPEGGVAAVAAAVRLDDALRGYLTEQGSKRVSKEDLWHLVGAALRLRLTAASLAGLVPAPELTPKGELLGGEAATLSAWYRTVATHIARAEPPFLSALSPSEADFEKRELGDPKAHRCLLDVAYHVRHLRAHHAVIIEPAARISALQHRPWWR
jgi:hypothetical protein